jgi:signal transduction histidine kinase
MPQRVLYIEGDASTRVVVRRLLEAGGFDVEESATGLDGIARARSSTPDLVIADTHLPDIEGLELAARLKQDRKLAEIPVVAVGHSAADHDVALAAGCDGFIAQPIDEARFVEEVRAYLAGKRERLETGAQAAARQRLAELDRRGSAFMHDLAHELSTPLTPLAGYIKILRSGRLGELPLQQRKVIDGMASAVAKLTRIVENLSDFASLQAGHSAITPSAVDPDALAEEVANEVESSARDARLRLEVRPSRGGPVRADPRKLRQALANIVQNAVKFSPHGAEILVEVSRDASMLRFSVYDHGPGVPPSELERIFEPFRHPERRGDARLPGSGLGLPVARRIAEAHGGRLVVESPPHTQPVGVARAYTGARFSIEIPAEPAAADPGASPPGG